MLSKSGISFSRGWKNQVNHLKLQGSCHFAWQGSFCVWWFDVHLLRDSHCHWWNGSESRRLLRWLRGSHCGGVGERPGAGKRCSLLVVSLGVFSTHQSFIPNTNYSWVQEVDGSKKLQKSFGFRECGQLPTTCQVVEEWVWTDLVVNFLHLGKFNI